VTLSYMQNNPMCPERTRFENVVVDEYQDLNRAEQALVDLLAENAALSIIGERLSRSERCRIRSAAP